ncbi:PKD domain-containing protein [Bacillus sp. EB01]|uniref:PKD domain-containing protein n=1 Tax=Bacillus sp. EB01 TaxID=1347086 RepID=UPI0006943FEE|nr:hypothetical protein [Bacillus sp. EB01]
MTDFIQEKKLVLKSLLLVLLCVLVAFSGGFFWGKASADDPPSGEKLVKMGPIGANGFPVWFKDANGTRLELCLDASDPMCAIAPEDLPNPNAPISWPDNFPSEAFYQLASAEMETGSGGRVVGNFQLEAAFTQEVPTDGQQMVFGRVRFRMDGLIAGEEYKIIHPYGIDVIKAEDDGEGSGEIRFTEDIGDMGGGNPHLALNSRIGTFLRWTNDPDDGYIGDPNVEQQVTGSVYTYNGEKQNFLRVEGKDIAVISLDRLADSVCMDPDETGKLVANKDCIMVRDFSLMGKEAVNSGIEIQEVTYSRTAGKTGGVLDVYAFSEDDKESIEVSGEGFEPVRMIGGKDGQYYARIRFTGEVPPEITVTNVGDTPHSVKTFNPADFLTAKAEYDYDAKTLTVTAESSDEAGNPTLTAKGFGELTEGKLEKTEVNFSPRRVTVTSTSGGTITVPVKVTGEVLTPIKVVAVPTVDQTEFLQGDEVTLDGTNSSGPITTYLWEQISGLEPVQLINPNEKTATFTAPSTPGEYVFKLTVKGSDDTSISSGEVTLKVLDKSDLVPIVEAGPDKTAEQGKVVNLSATGQHILKYEWTVVNDGVENQITNITLAGANTASPSFTFPKQAGTVKLEVKANGPGGSVTDTVSITALPDDLTVSGAEYRRDKREWRIDGASNVFGPGVNVDIFIGDTANGKKVATVTVDAIGTFRYRGAGNATATVPNGNTVQLTFVSTSGGKETFNARAK